MSQLLGVFGLLISPCYSPFSLGAHFETYKLFIYLIFQFWGSRGELQITESSDTKSVDMVKCLYFCAHLECHSLCIPQSQKIFEQNLKWKPQHNFYEMSVI
jgi:hypothetical protein